MRNKTRRKSPKARGSRPRTPGKKSSTRKRDPLAELRGRRILVPRDASPGSLTFVADYRKFTGLPPLTADPGEALSFKDRKGVYKHFRTHPQHREHFVAATVP